jgi:hypothetical protein
MIGLEQICKVRDIIEVLILHTVDDQRSPVEEDTGNPVWMWYEFFASHDTIENQTRIWKGTGLNSYCCRN